MEWTNKDEEEEEAERLDYVWEEYELSVSLFHVALIAMEM